MPTLTGKVLKTVRALSGSPLLVGTIWRQMGKDYGLGQLLDLPAEARGELEVEPRPHQAAPPRQWTDAGLAPPEPQAHQCTARQLQQAFQDGKTTPTEVLQKIRARIEAGSFGAATHSPFTDLNTERARQAADESTARWQAGKPLGPLDGVPIPVKDEHNIRGLVTRGGTRYRTTPAESDSFCVQALTNAGAIVYAKTHTTEWGMSPVGFNPHFSMPRCVYSEHHAPGGSSTGSAVAVGLGLAPAAIGSDGGGSIRIPAAVNGLFGIKPTYIRVGRTGDIFATGSMSHIGPIGQTTQDLVDVLEVIGATPDPDDPVSAYRSANATGPSQWRQALGRGIKGCRIGVPKTEWAAADPAIAAIGMNALAALAEQGAELVDIEIPWAAHAPATGVLVIAGETMGGLTDDMANHGKLMGDSLQLILRLLAKASTREYFTALRTRTKLREVMRQVFTEVHTVALPTLAIPTPAWSLSQDRVPISDDDANRGMCRFNFLGNLTGLPAGSFNAGTHEGLPVGLQIMGDAWDEASVLAVLAHAERMGISHLPAPSGHTRLLG